MLPREHAEITRAAQHWIASSATDYSRFDGISQLIHNELGILGAMDLTLLSGRRASLAGWFQETVTWDLVVLRRAVPVLAVTYASVTCNSDEDSISNEADQVLGIAKDTQLAQMHGILPASLRRAHVHLHELPPEEIGTWSAEDASRFGQAAIMCERMRDSGLYHLVWVIGVTHDPVGFTEPSPALGWNRFAAGLRSSLLL